MLITLHMFTLSVVCTLNTQLKLLLFKRCTVLRQTVNGNFNLTPTVCIITPYTTWVRGQGRMRVVNYDVVCNYNTVIWYDFLRAKGGLYYSPSQQL